jgi:putative transposase
MTGVARSTFYYRQKSETRIKKLESDLELRETIEKIHERFPGYGYRRIYEYLLRRGVRINSKRIRRIMLHYELFTALKIWMKPRGTHTGIRLRHPNLIKGMRLVAPNQVWATDITYIKLRREFVYLAAIIDVYTRKIVGWALSRDLGHELCLRAIEVAYTKEQPPAGVIHHSDRGVQYVCEPYVQFLLERGFKVSMSAVGTPNENAFIEAFFKTLKAEEVYARNYQDMEDVMRRLPYFIEQIYNKERLHSSLGYLSPEGTSSLYPTFSISFRFAILRP